MKIVPLTCPQCKASLEIKDDKRKFIFCEYCGQKIYIDDETKTIRQIDEARIREADVKERIRLAELELELATKKRKFIILIIAIVVIIALIGALYYVIFNTKNGVWVGLFLAFIVLMVSAIFISKNT